MAVICAKRLLINIVQSADHQNIDDDLPLPLNKYSKGDFCSTECSTCYWLQLHVCKIKWRLLHLRCTILSTMKTPNANYVPFTYHKHGMGIYNVVTYEWCLCRGCICLYIYIFCLECRHHCKIIGEAGGEPEERSHDLERLLKIGCSHVCGALQCQWGKETLRTVKQHLKSAGLLPSCNYLNSWSYLRPAIFSIMEWARETGKFPKRRLPEVFGSGRLQ